MHRLERFGAYIDAIMQLEALWGSATIGLKMTAAYCKGYGVTASSLATRTGISDDTARRHLERLVREAKVWVHFEGRQRVYYPVESFCLQTLETLEAAEQFHPQVAA